MENSVCNDLISAISELNIKTLTGVTVVCGAGFSQSYGLQCFRGDEGLFSSEEAAKTILEGISDTVYTKRRDRDGAIICGLVDEDGIRKEKLFEHFLSNDCLYTIPEFFYSLLGYAFNQELLEKAKQTIRQSFTDGDYTDFIGALSTFCKMHKKSCDLYTLNVDGLLNYAGLDAVELHGRLGTDRCSTCAYVQPGESHYMLRRDFSGTTKEYLNQSRCVKCGHLIRPEIVLLDEPESQILMSKFLLSLQSSSCIVSIGVNSSNHIGRAIAAEGLIPDKTIIYVTEKGIDIQKG